jgi:hypothetical protein
MATNLVVVLPATTITRTVSFEEFPAATVSVAGPLVMVGYGSLAFSRTFAAPGIAARNADALYAALCANARQAHPTPIAPFESFIQGAIDAQLDEEADAYRAGVLVEGAA